ncbi:uncharacterized protein LOC130670760 isoform X2 [Microplitis mediator]|uniref:uncharacterized protein LOC130670760 isoform X2 n=1 Tax=Microplitis mediator TaxID=375433 RepID=UPI002556B416|nr:uncharacterized protein LOC130670760 isoform X2 [Microplitis mediator]
MDAHDNYDPEVEARLYAEIYYSNDTYPDTNNPEPSSSSTSSTGMFPKRHRALIDGIKPTGRSRWEPPMAGGNYYDDLRPSHQFPDRDPVNPTFHVDARGSRSMPPFFEREPRPLLPYDGPRSVPSYDRGPRSLPPYDHGHRSVPPFDYDPRSLPSYDHDPRSLPPYDHDPRSMPPFDYGPRSLPPLDYIPNSNYRFDRNFLPNPMHQNSGFNQQDFIKLSSKVKNSNRQLELKNLKSRSRKLRKRDKSKKTNKPPPFKGINNNNDRTLRGNYRSPRKNPNRAARDPEFNKHTGDSSKDNDLDDSIEIIDIQEPVPDKPTAETETSCSVDASTDKTNDPVINDKNPEKTDNNSSKNDDNSEGNDNTANKNDDLDKDNDQSTSNFADDAQDLAATESENVETDKINDDDNSKYNVKCASADKSQPEKSKSSESEESSDSESDESIFEVPVPPKPPPLLISLNDSSESSNDDSDDDDNDVDVDADAGDDHDDKNDKEESLTTDLFVADSNNSNSSGENCSETNNEKQNDGDKTVEDDDDDDDDKEEEEEEENWIETNIILNCSQVQKSVSTMEELKKIGRESSVNLISDDSMTESEAMNWRTIEKEINTETTDELNTSMRLNISGGETNDGSDKRSPKSGGKGDKNQSPSSGSRKRAREAGGKNRDEFLKPIKLPRNEKTSEVSFEEYLAQPMPKQLLAFYTDYRDSEFMNDVRDIQSQMSRNPNRWAILDADIMYQRGSTKRLKCSSCQKYGHKLEQCPDKRKVLTCHMCGENGHLGSRCPQRMCLTCGKKYSSFRKTCEYCCRLNCTLCKSKGHLKTNCPDLWRRYHQTTTPDTINIPAEPNKILKPSSKLSCCNCTRRGHDSSTCPRYRWSQHFPSPYSVTSYTEGPGYPPRPRTSTSVTEPTVENRAPEPSADSDNQLVISEPPATQPSPSSSSSTFDSNIILYHYTNIPASRELESADWPSEIILPHEIPNISYEFVDNSSSRRPGFLSRHFPRSSPYLIDLIIKRIDSKNVEIKIKTPSEMSTFEFKKLIIQWLSRRPVDRGKMSTADPLPVKKEKMLNLFIDKLYGFVTNSSLKGIIDYDHEILSVKLHKSPGKIKSVNGKLKKNPVSERRCLIKLLSSLYNFCLIPMSENIIRDFEKLLNLLSTKGSSDDEVNTSLPQWIYLNCCWFNFELFTGHLSAYVADAKKCIIERVKEVNKLKHLEIDSIKKELGLSQMVTRDDRKKNGKIKKKSLQNILICNKPITARGVDKNNKKSGKNKGSDDKMSEKKLSKNKTKNPSKKVNDGKKIDNSLIVNGKINHMVLQREKLVSRAQAALDLAKKHGLKGFYDRAEEIIKKIRDRCNVKRNAIEQLWTDIVKELRGKNITVLN